MASRGTPESWNAQNTPREPLPVQSAPALPAAVGEERLRVGRDALARRQAQAVAASWCTATFSRALCAAPPRPARRLFAVDSANPAPQR